MTRRGIILFALLSVAWGIPYLLIKIAVGQLAPEMVVLSRVALAAIVLLPVVAARGELMPVLRRWPPVLGFAVAEVIIPQFCLSTAEERLPSSTTGLILAAVPLAGVGVAFAFGRPERLGGRNWLGIALGMGGVAALVGFGVAGSALGSVAEVLVVVVGYSIGPAILAKWGAGLPGAGVTAVAMTITTVVYLPFTTAARAWPAAWPSAPVLVSVALLALVCTAGGFIVLTALIAEVGPVRATTVTYVNPAIALIAGAVVLGERITVWSVVGFAAILAGCYLLASRRPAPLPGPGLDAPAVPESAV
ncbi:MAG: EamA family transporter [Streptosporangiales bacterium]|nr:EamA family transporter [Streptosporangiales bacterium]